MSFFRRALAPFLFLLFAFALGFCLCLWLHRTAPPAPISDELAGRLREGGFVPPSGKQPARPPDVPDTVPVIAHGRGKVPYGPRIPAAGPSGSPGAAPPLPAPGQPGPAAGSTPEVTPDDLSGECEFDLVGPLDAPLVRLRWTGRVRLGEREVARTQYTGETALEWRPPTLPASAPRTLLGGTVGVTSAPGYEIGGMVLPSKWAVASRWGEARIGAYARVEKEPLETRLAAGAVVLFGVGKR